ncbi:heterokaryon incompatibility protein-domain-containing protein [Triangularia setosa]|uniref:Heterokaryon incompatibility protein-domain-containing protein n=1 Tax=Triangularia setosa TaxID=2587417 RepID=A0AAN6VXM3_9PEZI|nr:heterokaryon incompatibility protein-domain-containing protein [Podospora setosa]
MVYKYSPLTQKCQAYDYTIRLLHLLPALDEKTPLHCRLIEKGYNDHWSHAPHHDYHGLLYTWGDPVFPELLDVLSNSISHATESLGAIPITQNLHSALKHLRRKDTLVVLWVDAVCINQADVAERNSQVSNMPKIYKKAYSTIVWLGDESDIHDARLCMNFFRNLQRLSATPQEDQLSASWRKRFEINRLVTDFLDESKAAIVYFLERPWFRRRWIVQEVVLAKSVAIHCGAWNIDWNTFHLAMFELFESDQGVFTSDHRTTMRTMMGVRDGGPTITAIRNIGVAAKKQLPLDTLVEFSSFLCTDPRDRLYALYGVIKRWSPRQVTMQLSQINNVDYSLPTEKVFTNFATELMRIDAHDLRPMASKYWLVTHVLQLAAAFGDGSDGEGHLGGKIPSWVVDWTGSMCFEPLQHSPKDGVAFEAITSSGIQFLPTKENPSLLVMIGLPFDIITTTISLNTSPMLLTNTVHQAKASLNKFLAQVAGCAEGDWYQPTSEHLVAALATSLVANWDHTPDNSYFGQNPRFINDFLEQLRYQHYHLPEILHKWPAYVELMAITMRGRCLFLSAKGYVGIAATGVKAGDILSLLDNQSVPFVLRPEQAARYTVRRGKDGAVVVPDCFDYQPVRYSCDIAMLANEPSSYNSFRLVSDAYVHGLMKGEGLKKMKKDGDHLPLKVLPIY